MMLKTVILFLSTSRRFLSNIEISN